MRDGVHADTSLKRTKRSTAFECDAERDFTMQYYTRLQESPTLATIAMLKVNPTTKVEVIPMEDHYGRTVTVRTIGSAQPEKTDSVYVCAGNNAVFVANVIALAHAHNVEIDAGDSLDCCDGI